MNSVAPTRMAWFLRVLIFVDTMRAEVAMVNVPIASSRTPMIGLSPTASVVDPRRVPGSTGPSTKRRVNPASNPPSV